MSPVPRTSRCSSGANEATRPKTTPCLLSSGQPEPRAPPSSLSRSESALCCAKVPSGCLANLPGRGGRTGTKFTAVTSRQAEGGAAGRERQGSARSHAASLPFTNFRHSSGPRCLPASRGQGHAGSRRAPAGWGLCPPPLRPRLEAAQGAKQPRPAPALQLAGAGVLLGQIPGAGAEGTWWATGLAPSGAAPRLCPPLHCPFLSPFVWASGRGCWGRPLRWCWAAARCPWPATASAGDSPAAGAAGRRGTRGLPS